MITLKILLARQISKRLESEARFHRRTLRDHQRREWNGREFANLKPAREVCVFMPLGSPER
jgi:serine/threonine-protein kinase RIO1